MFLNPTAGIYNKFTCSIITLYLDGSVPAEEGLAGLTCQGPEVVSQRLVSTYLAYFFSRHTSTLPHRPLFLHLKNDRFLTISWGVHCRLRKWTDVFWKQYAIMMMWECVYVQKSHWHWPANIILDHTALTPMLHNRFPPPNFFLLNCLAKFCDLQHCPAEIQMFKVQLQEETCYHFLRH